ncbi:MAG: endonuclease [Planctomycetaceae bacterium]|nr:endonuclease [Planctomycetaceae bacterium]
MSSDEIDRLLKHTIADHRLSRGERNVLDGLLAEYGTDEQGLAFLRHRVFEVAREELVGPDALAVIDWLEEAVKAMQPREKSRPRKPKVFFSSEHNCAKRVVHLLHIADLTVDICVFTITDDEITDAIIDCYRRDVTIRIITDDDKSLDAGSDIWRMKRNEIAVRTDKSEYHMHHKSALFDSRTLLTGSYNWTRSANDRNEENFIVTADRTLVAAFKRQFEKLWKKLG